MKTYNPGDYGHILKGSEIFLDKGIELTKDMPMPDKYQFSDQLLYQIGEASINGDTATLNHLIGIANRISYELRS